MTNEQEQAAKQNNLLVLFGASDDLLEMRGAIRDEVGAYDGGEYALALDGELYADGEKGVYLNLTAVEMREQRYGDTHVLKQSLAKEVYQAMSEEERMAQPIFGALKPIESQQRQMEVTQTTNAAEAVEDPDDLPF